MAFDDEGSPTQFKAVIQGGRLQTLLHNLKTARKAGIATTGNGGRGGAGSPVGVQPSNLYIPKGELEPAALYQALGDGLLITELWTNRRRSAERTGRKQRNGQEAA